MLTDILVDAFHRGASTVHLEPRGASLVVRLRIAGALNEVLHLPAARAGGLVDRINAVPLRFQGKEILVAAMPDPAWRAPRAAPRHAGRARRRTGRAGDAGRMLVTALAAMLAARQRARAGRGPSGIGGHHHAANAAAARRHRRARPC
ncbi:MAG: hypothetical protein WDN44_11335 [Sphingomonas sp.]